MLELALNAVGAAAGFAGFLLFFNVFRPLEAIHRLQDTARRSLRVLGSPHISDHRKERVLPRYALRALLMGLRLGLTVLLLLSGFCIAFLLALLPLTWDLSANFERMMHWQPQVFALLIAAGYTYFRSRRKYVVFATPGNTAAGGAGPEAGHHPSANERHPRPGAAYGGMARLLHEVALGPKMVRRIAFDIDCRITGGTGPEVRAPVYVAGLARSGTTALLEVLYASGCFTSLTYRDMPFVTAPGLWSRLSWAFQQGGERHERAHRDGMTVTPDSPEAFEEVFWLTALDAGYVTQRGLLPHRADSAVVEDYRRYLRNILHTHGGGPDARYLCKGNNNLLRIESLQRAHPDAVILIPFRHPIAHANSLLTQHRRFVGIQQEDPFSRRYMNWLGHFEFGRDMKPFLFDQAKMPRENDGPKDPMSLEYWLHYWVRVYGHLSNTLSDLNRFGDSARVRFFDYDHFCSDSRHSLQTLAELLDLEPSLLLNQASRIRPGRSPMHAENTSLSLLQTAETLHGGLQQNAITVGRQ